MKGQNRTTEEEENSKARETNRDISDGLATLGKGTFKGAVTRDRHNATGEQQGMVRTGGPMAKSAAVWMNTIATGTVCC